MPFNERLKELRKDAHLSQDGLAKAAGLSTDTVAKLERPGKEPSWDTVVKLARALGVSLDAFTDTDDAKPAESPAPESAPAKKGRKKP
jgi:transcriptional regulator with XRE-family HTH domain